MYCKFCKDSCSTSGKGATAGNLRFNEQYPTDNMHSSLKYNMFFDKRTLHFRGASCYLILFFLFCYVSIKL